MKSEIAVWTLASCLAWSMVAAQPQGTPAPETPKDGEVTTGASVNWHYPVPRPALSDSGALNTDLSIQDDEAIRSQVSEMRRISEQVVDGYGRQMENCRFDGTLHFDDQERSRLIGNDQACQSRYRHMIKQEQQSLRRRISQLRGPELEPDLHPVELD